MPSDVLPLQNVAIIHREPSNAGLSQKHRDIRPDCAASNNHNIRRSDRVPFLVCPATPMEPIRIRPLHDMFPAPDVAPSSGEHLACNRLRPEPIDGLL